MFYVTQPVVDAILMAKEWMRKNCNPHSYALGCTLEELRKCNICFEAVLKGVLPWTT